MAHGTINKATSGGGFAVGDFANGNRRQRVRDVQLTSGANYTTGGETITPLEVGLTKRIESVSNGGVARLTTDGSTSIPITVSHLTNGSVKIQGYVAATGAEQASNANLSTFSTRLVFVGI